MSLKKIKTFFRFSNKTKLLLISAFFILGWMRIIILFVPFKVLIKGKEMVNSPDILSKEQHAMAFRIGWAVNKMSRFTPWKSKCYVRALTAQLLLRRVHIPSTLYLGVSKDSTKNLIAHAWLRAGKVFVTGADEKDNFKCITYFTLI